jgi:hypothetical protein
VTLSGKPGKGVSIENVRVTETLTLMTIWPPVHVAEHVLTGVVGVYTPAFVAHSHDRAATGVGPVVRPFALRTSFAFVIIPAVSVELD